MSVNKRDLWYGITLLAAIPLLLLQQSMNSSKGTSKGYSQYNVDQVGGVLTEYLFDGNAEALPPVCDYALSRENSPALAEAWLENIASRCGESFYTRLVRGRLLALRGDRDGARREFTAAETCIPDAKGRERLDKCLREAGL